MGKSAIYATAAELAELSKFMYCSNALALEIATKTGLRISDVLKIRKRDLFKTRRGRCYVRFVSKKVGKYGIAEIDEGLFRRMMWHGESKTGYVFPGRFSARKHRTRQAVNKDMRRAAKEAGLDGLRLSPHSARKNYAVGVFRAGGLEAVKEKLQHDHDSTAALYAFSDQLTRKGTTDDI